MTVRLRIENIPANGQLQLSQGNYILIISLSANVTLNLYRDGTNEDFAGAITGLEVGRLRGWQTGSNIAGAAGTTVTFFYGTQSLREDITVLNQQVATISGTVTAVPGNLNVTSHADVLVASGATDITIAVNAGRKSVIVGSMAKNAPSSVPPVNLRVREHGAAAGGTELQPGTFIVLPTPNALDVFNGDASGQTYWWQELS